MTAVLEVEGLTTRFATPDGEVLAADGVGFSIGEGESLGVVGESGSGKTQIFLSIMGLLAKNGRSAGSVRYRGKEILNLPTSELNRIRGDDLAMIFQDPMTSLNPFLKISRQLTEVIRAHKGVSEAEARKRGIAMLDLVGIPEAARRFDMYPHEFSGGMRQRAMIAMAVANDPDLLIADEPTTALDVTVQAQIMEVLAGLQKRLHLGLVLITHDLGVLAGHADRVVVMYSGEVVEQAAVDDLFARPAHPYTRSLIASIPDMETERERLFSLEGVPPALGSLPRGCAFHPRCPQTQGICRERAPVRHQHGDQLVACQFAGSAA